MIGTEISNYKITRLIGEGGMASVYEGVHNTLTNRKVAIKILHQELASDANVRDRFVKEANILSTINHPGIVNIFDFVEVGSSLAIIMEKLEGLTLDEYILKNGALSKEIAIDIFSKILDAFDFAHKNGIVHRDVKPSNIYVEKSMNVKILDFGIAKILSGNLSHTATGSQLGTPLYMSPEQVQDSKNIDHRTDIYSLGVVFYFMLTGKKIYDSNTDSRFQIMTKIVNEPIPILHNYPALNTIIQTATAKNPNDRFQTCEAFWKTLNSNDIPNKNISPPPPVDFEKTEPGHIKNSEIDANKTFIIPAEKDKSTKKKKNSLKIILPAAGFVVVAVIAVFLFVSSANKKKQERYDTNIAKADSLYNLTSYDSAIVYYNKALEDFPEDSLSNKKIEMTQKLQHALRYFYDADYDNAFTQFTELIDFNCPEAYYYLGEMYFNGNGVDKSDSIGDIYTQKALDNNFTMAYWRKAYTIMTALGYDDYNNLLSSITPDTTASTQADSSSIITDSTQLVINYFKTALPSIRKLALQGDPEAQGNLGWFFSKAIIVEQNDDSTEHWYLQAASQGACFAQSNLGYFYYDQEDYEQAFEWFTKAADKKDNNAIYGLATMYYAGKGVDLDYTKALEYFTIAADNNMPGAIYQLGYMYYNGKGTSTDYSLAHDYFTQAADLDYHISNWYLGNIYRYGKGVSTNYTTAISYYKKYGDAGNASGYVACAEIYEDIYDNEIQGFQYYKKAALLGDADAQNSVGYRMYFGKGTTEDRCGSLYWFKKSMYQGNSTASDNYYYVLKNNKCR
ncbi:MAG: SEL1-like repeat protein [Bacteroidales bacterium]|nr:SEL1-like repeat protein [Bacteroidales bacterium]